MGVENINLCFSITAYDDDDPISPFNNYLFVLNPSLTLLPLKLVQEVFMHTFNVGCFSLDL